MNKKPRVSQWLLIALVIASLLSVAASCSAPPEQLNKAVSALPGQIDAARKANDKAKSEFAGLLKRDRYAFIASYPANQQHADRFGQANAKLNEAKKANERQVEPIVNNYDDKKKAKLEGAIAAVNGLITQAKQLTADPAAWLEKVAATKANPDGTVRNAAGSASEVTTAFSPIRQNVETAKTAYASNASAIASKFQPIAAQQDNVAKAYALLQVESKKTPPNYAIMTEQATVVTDNATAFKKDAPAFAAKLAALNNRETHTLLDIRVDTTIEISRTTWDDAYDMPDEHDYDYPVVPIDQDTATYFAKFGPDDVLAEDSTGWGGKFTAQIDRKQWDKLNIKPREPKWHKDDSAAEFYVGEIDDTYCHKQKVLENGKPDISGRPKPADNYCSKYDVQSDLDLGIYWVEADDLSADALGMDVYSKGLGDFDDQADAEATPPGMVYVGDTSTGEWRNDDHGNSFWYYYGQYRFFSDVIGGPYPYHYRYEYDDWNRSYRYGHKPYYGTYNGQPRYGLKSPLTASRLPNSHYVSSGMYSSSVRGAGPAARAGGPGGGGK